ncbi:MAG: hypothetical protein AAGC63_15730 [Propionicimonas sp.]|nr:hypothetical protein [Propionicimonas sp.]
MTASVADLLDRLHAHAFAISNLTTRPSEDRWRAQAVVWPRLALATMRAMNNVPQGSATNQELILVDSILQPIARNEWFLSVSEAAPVPNVPPDKRLVDMVRVLGGLADLLSLGLKGVVSDPAATLGLRANLLSPVMVAANWSLATAPDVPRNMNPRRHLQLVSGIGAAFAFIPPALRPGQYDDIAAVPHSENSLDAAIHNWLDAAKDALATRKGLSGMTLQTIAADLSVVCAAAAATTNAAIALDQLAEDRGRPVVEAITDANARWREASRWPQTIYLGGVRDTGLADASTYLRQTVVETLREGRAWAEPQGIARRMPGQDLLAVARRAMHAAADAGEQQHAAVTNLFWGKDRVMIASRALEGATYMNKVVFTARRRSDWIPMPRCEPTGLEVYRAATNASNATFIARQLAVATAKPSVSPLEPASPAAVDFTQGRIAAPETTAPSLSIERLTKEPPFGMGTGGPEQPSLGPDFAR